MKNRIIAMLVLMSVLFQVFAPSLLIKSAFAYQTHPENFSRDYTLIGDWREDIVSVARAQYGKTKSMLGYTESWCANFVCDCAKLAKIPNWPCYGSCDDLIIHLQRDMGGIWHPYNSGYSPKKGDFVFLSKFGNNSDDSTHVGIIYADGFDAEGRIYTIEGNITDGDGQESRVWIKKRTITEGSILYVQGYIEINQYGYSTYGQPTDLRLDLSTTGLKLGQSMNISCSAKGAERYTVNVFQYRTCVFNSNAAVSTFTPDKIGTYELIVSAQNGSGSSDVVKLEFSVANTTTHTNSVTFIDGMTNNVFCKSEVIWGRDVVFPFPPEHDGYAFVRWDNDGREIKNDTTITALYNNSSGSFTSEPTPTPYYYPTPTPYYYTTPYYYSTPAPTQGSFLMPPVGQDNVLRGDTNDDRAVNAIDAVLVLKYIVDVVFLDKNALSASDTNRDNLINSADVALILRYSVGIITEF